MAFPLSALLGPVVGAATDWLKNRQVRKAVALENEVKLKTAVTEAKIKRLETQQAADIAWENTSIEQGGWKDEYLTILLSVPMILCFIPGGAQYVAAGFQALQENTPDWYQWAFLVVVASSFGYKKIADFMALKKGV